MRLRPTALLALALAGGAAAQEDAPDSSAEAEKLFREAEGVLRAAETLQLRFAGGAEATPDGPMEIEGSLALDLGNRVHFRMTASLPAESIRMEIVSDGAEQVMTTAEGDAAPRKHEQAADPGLRANLLGAASRAGVFLPVMMLSQVQFQKPGAKPAPPTVEELYPVEGFTLLEPETVDGRDALVIGYRLASPDLPGGPLELRLWIDEETKAPIRRTIVIAGPRGEPIEVLETYSDVVIDEEIDPATFDLDAIGEDAAPATTDHDDAPAPADEGR